MSAGSLPLATYHRAQSLGSGTYGSVVTVYNDDGDEFALKLFLEDDDDDDNKEEEEIGVSLGSLREVSILRLFRHENAHPNIVAMHDVQTAFGEEDAGAGTGGCLSMAMDLFPEGSLMDAIEKKSLNKAEKIKIAHGLLSAVAHLHENSILHRDIKCDNVLLRRTPDGSLEAVLIDFSLAKMIDPSVTIPGGKKMMMPSSVLDGGETTHSPTVGTPTYRAPEVIAEEEYSFPSDLWSVGVCLLEMVRGRGLETQKDKGALALIEDCLEDLPKDQPFPTLIRGLLERDPSLRHTARQALESIVFAKHGLKVHDKTFSRVNILTSLPFDNQCDDDEDNLEFKNENAKPSVSNCVSSGKKKNAKKRVDPVISKRFQRIRKICQAMEWVNPVTAQAALTYSTQMSELADMEDPEDQGLLDCVVLAHRFFERYLTDLRELNAHPTFADWDIEEYEDNEGTIFMLMDFCLFPRQYIEV